MLTSLIILIDVAGKTTELAKELTPLLFEIPLDDIPLDNYDNLIQLCKRLTKLIDGTIFSKEGSLNDWAQDIYEFLDNMRSLLFLIEPYSNDLNSEHIKSLEAKTNKLITQLNSPPFLQHRKRTPEDATKPFQAIFSRKITYFFPQLCK